MFMNKCSGRSSSIKWNNVLYTLRIFHANTRSEIFCLRMLSRVPKNYSNIDKKEKCSSEMCYNLKSICDKTYKHRPGKHTNWKTIEKFDIFILDNSNMFSSMEVTTVFPYGQRSLAITNGTQTLFIILSKKKHINKFIWPCFVIKVKPF